MASAVSRLDWLVRSRPAQKARSIALSGPPSRERAEGDGQRLRRMRGQAHREGLVAVHRHVDPHRCRPGGAWKLERRHANERPVDGPRYELPPTKTIRTGLHRAGKHPVVAHRDLIGQDHAQNVTLLFAGGELAQID